MKISQTLLMLISLPMLVIGWFLLGIGGYFLGASIFDYSTAEDAPSLAAIWAFMFSFGVISAAGLVAAKAEFVSNMLIRKVYKNSIILSASLFLGYLVIGLVVSLVT